MASDDADLLALRPRWIALAEAADSALAALAAAEERCGARYPARPRWEHGDSEDPQHVAEYEAAIATWRRAQLKVDAKEGLTAIRDRELEAGRALDRFAEESAKVPARTLAGVRFKAEVSMQDEQRCQALCASIAADIMSFAPTV